MGKTIRIDTYFKRKSDKISKAKSSLPTCNVDTPISPTSNGLKFVPTNSGITTKTTADMVKDGMDKVQPSGPPPRKPIFPTWAKWVFGSLMSIIMPFWKLKWGSLILLEDKVEQVVEEVEVVVEVVEKVAETAEKVSAEVADKFPDNSKLKEAALIVEHISTVAATDAEMAEDVIHKVEELKRDLTDLGTLVEPVIGKIIPKEHGGN